MARAIFLALAYASLASGARYVDYSGVKMPQYSGGEVDYEGSGDAPAGPSDDYRDHSPGAPASLDYKYEEESIGKTENSLSKEVEEVWQKPVKIQRRRTRPIDDADLETLDKFSSDEIVPKFKTSHRFSKHRPRLKIRNSGREHETILRRLGNYGHSRNDDISDADNKNDLVINPDDFNDDKNIDYEEKSHLAHEDTTPRVIRRKPRDRRPNSQLSDEDKRDNDDNLSVRRLNKEGPRDEEYVLSTNEGKQQQAAARRQPQRFPDSDEDDDAELRLKPRPTKSKIYDDYNEYYDMKRVQSIKNKLPTLLRRPTKARTQITTTTPLRLWERVLPNRRLYLAPFPNAETKSPTTFTATTRTTTPETTTTQSTVAPKSLSLAEKSRLSILKKAQRKESSKNDTIKKKPPVLLQVINKVQTVLMVEPPTSANPWLRAREIVDDTPENLEKVKRLMRHKLVANAKNIHELTNNWDEMVCDYVDVSLLEYSGSTNICVNLFLLIFNNIIFVVIAFRLGRDGA